MYQNFGLRQSRAQIDEFLVFVEQDLRLCGAEPCELYALQGTVERVEGDGGVIKVSATTKDKRADLNDNRNLSAHAKD